MNFFEIVNSKLGSLTKNEQALFDYVVKNMNKIKNQSIREVASETYVSTATFLRFVKKIGFVGFSEFTTVIKYTVLNEDDNKENPMPFEVSQSDYREEYLKNIIESVRVMPTNKMHELTKRLAAHPEIYLFAKGVSKHVCEYIDYLFTIAGFTIHFPADHDYRQVAYRQIHSQDLVFILSYDGKDEEFIKMLNQLTDSEKRAYLVSVTEPDNNAIQNLSDVNFYIFTDSVTVNNVEIGSRISMLAVMELILYQYIEDYGDRDFNFKKEEH
ncbi:MurR/RpiR family transcriptional regulator [Pediococcus siamensis]|uniref:MurR/RpiR family transcriptional regulator n=1 Tax=Pediococcus siamensis TaxID=381829 RepID=UPI0039A06177